ncbi:hypothetical protein Y1Q_0002113 [Alligator mississippiensis]|uniref:Uncharacterized protein n=1 Tax=Alligator mississippiensis TaxID=8496 RepID=A0A151MJ23_ALLMI|nr:hypothetical protein Y1Q_0002113 [Alligator mississippiensis]
MGLKQGTEQIYQMGPEVAIQIRKVCGGGEAFHAFGKSRSPDLAHIPQEKMGSQPTSLHILENWVQMLQ